MQKIILGLFLVIFSNLSFADSSSDTFLKIASSKEFNADVYINTKSFVKKKTASNEEFIGAMIKTDYLNTGYIDLHYNLIKSKECDSIQGSIFTYDLEDNYVSKKIWVKDSGTIAAKIALIICITKE